MVNSYRSVSGITRYKLVFGSFRGRTKLDGLAMHLTHEWVIVANLFCLLLGFACSPATLNEVMCHSRFLTSCPMTGEAHSCCS